jgi:hypothetical protein
MSSNTKLSKSEKLDLRENLADFANTVHSFDFWYDKDNGITTMTVTPFKGANTLRIATSIMSPDEKKFRYSVGRYYAFSNYINGKFIDTPININLDIFNYLASE